MMSLTILSAESKATHEVAWIEANTPDGNFVIQPEHAPTTLVLSPEKDLIFCLSTGKHETLTPARGGILHVTRKDATVLLS